MQFGEAFLSLIPQMDRSAGRRTELEAHAQGQRTGQQFSKGFDKGTKDSGAGAFGTTLAVMGAKATIAGAGVAALTPAVLQLTAALVPAAGVLVAYPGLLLGIKAASAVTRVAVMGVGDAIQAGFGDNAKKAAEELKKLPPEARKFATSTIAMKDSLTGLQERISDDFFAPINKSFGPLTERYLPLANKELPVMARAIGTSGALFAEAATKGMLFGGVRDLLRNTTTSIAIANDATRDVSDSMGVLLSASSRTLPIIARGFRDGASNAADFMIEAEKAGKFDQWFAVGAKTLGQVFDLLKNIGSIVASVLKAASNSTGDLLGTIVSITAQMAAFLKTAEGTSGLENFFTITTGISTALRQGLALILPQIGEALKILAPAVAPLVGSFLQLVGALSPLIPVAARIAVIFASVLAGAASTLATALGPVLQELTSSTGGFDSIATSAEKLGPALNQAASSVSELTPALNLSAEAIAFMVENTDTLIKWLPLVVAGFIAWKVAQLAGNIAMAASIPIRIAEIIAMRQQTAALLANAAAQGVETTATNAGTGSRLAAAASWVGARVAMVAGTVATAAATAAQWLLNAAFLGFPLVWIVAAIAAVVAAIVLLWKNNETFREVVKAVWEAIKTAIKATVDWIVNTAWPAIKTAWNAIADAAKWLWKNVIEPAWQGIKTAIDVAWKVIKVIFDSFVAAVKIVGAIFEWLWKNIIEPVWKGILLAIQVAWKAIEIIFKIIEIAVRALGLLFEWLWKNVIIPVWDGIKLAITVAWTAIKIIFDAVVAFLKTVFGPAWEWLKQLITTVWEAIKSAISAAWTWVKGNVLDPAINFLKTVLGPAWDWLKEKISQVWDSIKSAISTAWNFIKSNIFDPLMNAIKTTIPNAFEAGARAIGVAWDKIKELAKAPVKFVLETVLNNGIIKGINWVAEKVGAGTISPIPMPFATGGVLPGYTPGRDVHRFFSRTGGALDLSGGEAIMRPEWTRAVGSAFVNAGNKAARGGGVTGVKRFLSGYLKHGGNPQFASGGIYGGMPHQRFEDGGIMGALSSAWDALTDPAEALKKLVSGLIGNVPGGGKMYPDMLKSAATQTLDHVVEWVKSKLSSLLGGAGGPGNWEAMWNWVKQRFPSAQLYSGLRNSTTLSGNTSLHASGRAIDVSPMRAIAEAIRQSFGSKVTELIAPWRELDLWKGAPHTYSEAVHNQHSGSNAHVHWAMKLGGTIAQAVLKSLTGGGTPFAFDGGGWLTRGMIGVHRLRKPDAVLTNDEAKGLKAMGVGDLLGALRELIEATRDIPRGVGGHINGVGRRVTIRGRIL